MKRIRTYRPPANITDTLVKVVIVGVGVYFVRKAYKEYVKNKTEQEAGSNPSVQQAQALRSAMNPGPFEWLKRTDGTDEESIFRIAAQIKSISEVIDAYKKLYGDSLYEDLQAELNAEDYLKFQKLFSYNPESKETTVNIPIGSLVVTKLEANARKTPKVISKLSFGSNIIKLVPSGKLIGRTTGKKAFDAANNTAFIEVRTYNGKNLFWVAISQVAMYTSAEFEKSYGKKIAVTMIEQFPNVSFSGFLTKKNVVILITKAPVYNQYGEVMARPEGKTILGNYLMEITKKDKTSLIQFQNIEGNIRLVDKRFVQIVNV